jgi:uncharacterized membrane protein (UPF0127 family)
MGTQALLALLTLSGVLSTPPSASGEGARRDVATLGGTVLELRIAATAEERFRGLEGVESLAPNEGMLFLYPVARSMRFWMAGCRMDLDIAYLDQELRILSIKTCRAPREDATDAEVDRAPSPGPVATVIELPAGWFRRNGVTVGARLSLSPVTLLQVAI